MKKMNNKGQIGGLGSAITSLFAVGVTTGAISGLFGKVKSGFMSKTESIFFKK